MSVHFTTNVPMPRVAAPQRVSTAPTMEQIHAVREANSSFREVRQILADRRATNPRPAFPDDFISGTLVDVALMSCDTWADCLRVIRKYAAMAAPAWFTE